jgi:hypothetical protein
MPPALGVTEQVVIDMNRWLSGDALLNPPIRADSDSAEWLDRLVDEGASQETALAASDELDNRLKALALLLAVLNDRERRFFEARRLAGGPDHARRTRRRVRRLARAPAPDRRELILEGTEGGEEPHRRDRNSVATAGALAPRGGRNCRRECSLSTARVHGLRRGQIHIALHYRCSTNRDFLPCRFSDAGRKSAWMSRHSGVRKPPQQETLKGHMPRAAAISGLLFVAKLMMEIV